MQHLQFAQSGVAGVELQAGIIVRNVVALGTRGRGATMEQVRLHALKQAVVRAFRGIGIGGDLARRVHDLVAAEQGHEVLAGRAPVAQQGVVLCVVAERCRALAQACAERSQVAPVMLGRRRQIEMQGADTRLRGQHAQHVRRDVQRAEREQALRQSRRQCIAVGETREVVLDPPRTMLAAAGDGAPQDRLRIIRIGTAVPAQQPVATPGLVLVEDVGQFAGQRPRFQRIGIAVVFRQIGRELGHRRLPAQRGIGQRGVQAPVQGVEVEVVLRRAEVGIQRARDELARGEELEVCGDAVARGQRGLQPAPHRHLRDQDRVGRQQRLAGHVRAQCFRQQAGEHVQRIAVIEAKVGGGRHRSSHCAGAGRAGCDRLRACDATPCRRFRSGWGCRPCLGQVPFLYQSVQPRRTSTCRSRAFRCRTDPANGSRFAR